MNKRILLSLVVLLIPLWFASATPKFSVSHQDQAQATKASAKGVTTAGPGDDASIAATIKGKLAKSNSTKDASIDVDVKDGVVTLKGKVQHGYQKGTATRMAKTVAGVKSVNNLIEVESASRSGASSKGK